MSVQEGKQWAMNADTKMRLYFSVMGTVLFSLAANAFAYFNFYPQHDAINHALGFAGAWEVSLGRFLLPIYGAIFGNVTTPWLIGIFSMLFLSGVSFLVSDLFKLKDRWFVFFLAGTLSANVSITEMCATFMYVEASYLLALLFSCTGAYLLISKPCLPRMMAAVLLFLLSMGLYQAYMPCVLLLFLFAMCKDVLTDRKLLKNSLPKWLFYFSALLLTGILYIIGYIAALAYWKITPAESGNSPTSLFSLSIEILVQRIKLSYQQFLGFFYGTENFMGMPFQVANILLTLIAIFLLLWYLVRANMPVINDLMLVVLVIVYPLLTMLMGILRGADPIYFLMTYALFFFYPGLLFLISKVIGCGFKGKKSGQILRNLTLCLLAIIVWQNIVYSNGAYTTQKLLYDRTLSIVTRVMEDVDETPGYQIMETPIIIVGTFSENQNLAGITEPFSAMKGFQKASTTYALTFQSFARLMGYGLNVESNQKVLDQYTGSLLVQEMPSYPELGYCQMLDGYLVIKLS